MEWFKLEKESTASKKNRAFYFRPRKNKAPMRIIAQIPHAKLKISIFQYNEKYIIEMEAGQYKQTFKIGVESVSGVDGVKELCTDVLVENALQRFNAMHTDFSQAFQNLSNK